MSASLISAWTPSFWIQDELGCRHATTCCWQLIAWGFIICIVVINKLEILINYFHIGNCFFRVWTVSQSTSVLCYSVDNLVKLLAICSLLEVFGGNSCPFLFSQKRCHGLWRFVPVYDKKHSVQVYHIWWYMLLRETSVLGLKWLYRTWCWHLLPFLLVLLVYLNHRIGRFEPQGKFDWLGRDLFFWHDFIPHQLKSFQVFLSPVPLRAGGDFRSFRDDQVPAVTSSISEIASVAHLMGDQHPLIMAIKCCPNYLVPVNLME